MTTDRLELLLHEVVREIDYPDTPDLSHGVATRIAHDPLAPERHPSRRMARNRWRPALAAALVMAVAVVTLAFSPTARRAVAELVGVFGIQISVGERSDGPPPSTDLQDADLGERVSMREARAAVGFELKVPSSSVQTGWRRKVFLDRSVGESGMVSFAYQSDALDDPDIEFLITQFRASVDETFLKKSVAGGGEVRFVDVRGTTGFWLTGEPHTFIYVESDGDTREETARLAGNVLLWEENGITYRVEGPRSLRDAQRMAESLR